MAQTSVNKQNDNVDENTSIDQIVADLSILEYQLINSVSQRKEPMYIGPDVKDSIIESLDVYFQDRSSIHYDSVRLESLEQTIIEHKPYIDQFNQSVSDTKIIIGNLQEAQLYMFQVYACHDTKNQSITEARSINGIILAVRTKADDRMYLILID